MRMEQVCAYTRHHTASGGVMGISLVKKRAQSKTRNLGDGSAAPTDWPLERRQQYFDWARNVIDELRGEWSELEAEFDRRYELRPTK